MKWEGKSIKIPSKRDNKNQARGSVMECMHIGVTTMCIPQTQEKKWGIEVSNPCILE